jgi:hypothetical protein
MRLDTINRWLLVIERIIPLIGLQLIALEMIPPKTTEVTVKLNQEYREADFALFVPGIFWRAC